MELLIDKNLKNSQAQWAYNVWACDDAYNAWSQHEGLAIEAHGYSRNGRWVMEYNGQDVDVEQFVRSLPAHFIFIYVCNPGGHDISPRPDQEIVYAKTTIRGGAHSVWWVKKG